MLGVFLQNMWFYKEGRKKPGGRGCPWPRGIVALVLLASRHASFNDGVTAGWLHRDFGLRYIFKKFMRICIFKSQIFKEEEERHLQEKNKGD